MYIGLAVRLYVFINNYFTRVQTFISIQERTDQETDRIDSLFSSLSVCVCSMILHKRSYVSILSFEKLHYFDFYRTLSDCQTSK